MSDTKINFDDLDGFTRSYIVAALWSTSDESTPSGVPFDKNYTGHNIAPDSLARMDADCKAFRAAVLADAEFVEKSREALADAGFTLEESLNGKNETDGDFGYDFWFTRAGHGVGFWDGGYEWLYDGAGNRLTEICKRFPARTLYLGDDGKVHECSA